ncbi:MAG: hypothetical protein ABL879_15705 [Devosia sp.]
MNDVTTIVPRTSAWSWLARLRIGAQATRTRRIAETDLESLSPHLRRDLGFIDAGPFCRPLI